jgi:uncharacterized protein YndB with AHSA1/START domain
MPEYPEALERSIEIRARPETVFRYFTDSPRFARWWGAGSSIDGRVGGEVRIVMPGGNGVRGEILEIEPPRRIVFTYRYDTGIPADGSLVTITFEETKSGTRLHLRHAFSSAKIRDAHVQGWRYQLALFSKAVSEEGRPEAIERVDAWLSAWGNPDAGKRRELLEGCARRDVVFRDAYSATEGLEDLLAHLEAVQTFFPGVSLAREGDVRLSHATAAADWIAKRGDGSVFGRGLNLYDFSSDGRIARVVGFGNLT